MLTPQDKGNTAVKLIGQGFPVPAWGEIKKADLHRIDGEGVATTHALSCAVCYSACMHFLRLWSAAWVHRVMSVLVLERAIAAVS